MSTMTQARPRADWRWYALAASLVLNLFLAAVIGGNLLRPHVRAVQVPASDSPLARALARAEATLSPRDAAAFRAEIEHGHSQYAQAAQQVMAARLALGQQVLAEPFDPQAASQALAVWRASSARFLQDFSGPLINALASISPEGRCRLVAERREGRESGSIPLCRQPRG
jgi:uncharacterized membrane protein